MTSNASRVGSSQAVIGSTKVPVVNSQRRTAPTPRPSIVAPIGHAIPARNTHSSGSGSSGKAITVRHTVSIGASMSIDVHTA